MASLGAAIYQAEEQHPRIVSTMTNELSPDKTDNTPAENISAEHCNSLSRESQLSDRLSFRRIAGRYSDFQAAKPTHRRFPPLQAVLIAIFVPDYRCGAVPVSHRIPSCVTPYMRVNQQRITLYVVLYVLSSIISGSIAVHLRRYFAFGFFFDRIMPCYLVTVKIRMQI